MSKAIFLGADYYTWIGMRNILRGSIIYTDTQYFPVDLMTSETISTASFRYVFIHPTSADVLKYASVVRSLSSRSSFTLFVLTNAETFSVFQTLCGLQAHFLDQNSSLDALFRRVTTLLQSDDALYIQPLANAITENEFSVMMLFSRGWSLAKIAKSAHKSEKTISTWKSNIARKIGHSNVHLKYIFSQFR